MNGDETRLSEVLTKMIAKVWDCDAAAASKMAMVRCARIEDPDKDDILKSEEAADIMEPQESKAVLKEIEDHEDEAEELDCLLQELADFAREAVPAAKKKAKTELEPWGRDMRFTIEELRRRLPPDARIWLDPTASRYQVFYKDLGSCSRSFQVYGHAEASYQVCRWAWSLYVLQTRDAGPYKWL